MTQHRDKTRAEMAGEIVELRAQLDEALGALGYPAPADLVPRYGYSCGLCGAKDERIAAARAENERLKLALHERIQDVRDLLGLREENERLRARAERLTKALEAIAERLTWAGEWFVLCSCRKRLPEMYGLARAALDEAAGQEPDRSAVLPRGQGATGPAYETAGNQSGAEQQIEAEGPAELPGFSKGQAGIPQAGRPPDDARGQPISVGESSANTAAGPSASSRDEFARSLSDAVNRHSKENGSNTPDFILGQFTEEQIASYCESVGWRRTGVFATEAETDQARVLMAEASVVPVARVHGTWLHESADKLARAAIHRMALAHGLPDLAPTGEGPDLYGIIVTGEFVAAASAAAAGKEPGHG